MNAREMLEELGFKLSTTNEWQSTFTHADNKGQLFVGFHNTDKSVTVDYFVQRGGPNQERTESKLSMNLLSAIYEYCKELKWIEEKDKHFEEKQETNYEHYKDEIIEDTTFVLALVDGKPRKCSGVNCNECEFSTGHGCSEKIKEWLNKPYEKPSYKLSQFEFDLLNAYKNSGMRQCITNYSTLLELYEKGHIKDIDTSTPIHEILDNCEVIK